MVDLPEAERPVSHIVKPCWRLNDARSARASEGCHVMFLEEGVD